MGNGDSETEEEQEAETFEVELSASMIYSLNAILHHASIEMDDPIYRRSSKALSQEVQNVIASDQFQDALDDEMEEFDDQYLQQQSTDDLLDGKTGTFQ
jgi:hypothetical protein